MVSKGKVQVKGLDTDDSLQLGLESESPAAPRAKRQARQAEEELAKNSYSDSIKELDDILLKFKKYSKSFSSIENEVFGSSNSCFQSKNERVDTYSFACSSVTDKIEEYFYDPKNSFPYKRGVKLVPKENSIYVAASADTDIYGICVDVCEFSCIAYVLPITNNFEGYLVTRNPNIKSGEILDINNDGVIIKAGGGRPTVINAYALSDSFTINFLLEDEDLKQVQVIKPKKEDFSINLIKVAIFGNRGLEKEVVAHAVASVGG
ncbi:DUF228 domain-containing protein [Borreliella americana]|uniref:DUF228 domain-containing protein n=1 Tax=Borreliella americana TaxID=478807 RepID=UPI001E33A9D1|nr:DUF228 domain-containing protein [Borreliella americana]MCD2332815.1 DUF228 domain-containing protein [Borreliella americana]